MHDAGEHEPTASKFSPVFIGGAPRQGGKHGLVEEAKARGSTLRSRRVALRLAERICPKAPAQRRLERPVRFRPSDGKRTRPPPQRVPSRGRNAIYDSHSRRRDSLHQGVQRIPPARQILTRRPPAVGTTAGQSPERCPAPAVPGWPVVRQIARPSGWAAAGRGRRGQTPCPAGPASARRELSQIREALSAFPESGRFIFRTKRLFKGRSLRESHLTLPGSKGVSRV